MIQILQGCALARLATLAADSVDCVVTSPPYWGLRDYQVPPTAWPACAYTPMPGLDPIALPAEVSCLGLEPTLHAFLAHLVLIFEEVRRVLKPGGTCWVNMGDAYANDCFGTGSKQNTDCKQKTNKGTAHNLNEKQRYRGLPDHLKRKDLQGQPWRVAFALQAAGWWLRSEIIWHKPNPMPESITDRATKAHEQLFMLTKSPEYFFDQEAWKEPIAPATAKDRIDTGRFRPDRFFPGRPSAGNGRLGAGDTRNKRTVWTIPTTPYKEAHYATFPPELVRPCIRAGCPPQGVVLDPFGGSGTTAQVALEEGRAAIVIELGAQNLPLIEQRLASITPGLPALA